VSTQERFETRDRDGRPNSANGRVAAPAGGWQTPAGERLPRPPGTRRPGMAVLAVLLIVLGAAVAGLLATRLDDRKPVLVASHSIAVGQRISSNDLAVARIASSGVAVIPAGQADQVVGRYANTEISSGRLIDAGMLTTQSLLTAGNVAVGVALQPGRLPASGLQTGDVVQVVQVPSAGDDDGKVISNHAVVGSVQTAGDSVFGSSNSDTIVMTVIVPQNDATAVAAASARDQASLVLLQRGGALGSG
jgi:hypothetical protein